MLVAELVFEFMLFAGRQLSGAQIKISNCEDGNSDRKVTITGVPETITLAAYLINTRLVYKTLAISTSSHYPLVSKHPYFNISSSGYSNGNVDLGSVYCVLAI